MTTYTTNSDFSTDAVSTAADGNPNTTAITGWTVLDPLDTSGGPNSVYTITSDGGGGKYCAWTETGWGQNDHTMGFNALGSFDATTADMDWLFQFDLPSLSKFEVVGKFLWNSSNYYGLYVTTSGEVQLYYFIGVSFWASLGSLITTPDAGSSALSAGTKYWCRVHRTSAGAWSWKIWSGAVGDEPGSWSVGDGGSGGVSNTTVTTGQSGIGGYQGTSQINYYWFAAGTGEAAPGPSGGTPSVSGAALAQAQSLTSPTLTQHHILTGNNLAQAQAAENAALTQHYAALVTADLAQGHALDSPTLTQHFAALVAAALSQSQAMDAGSLTQHHQLTGAAMSQAQSLGNVTLLTAALSIADLAQAHALASPGLTQHHQITGADLLQAHAEGNVDLVQHYAALAVADLTQGHALDAGSLTAAALNLLPADIAQAQSVASVVLTQHNILAVQNLLQAQSLGGVALTGDGVGGAIPIVLLSVADHTAIVLNGSTGPSPITLN